MGVSHFRHQMAHVSDPPSWLGEVILLLTGRMPCLRGQGGGPQINKYGLYKNIFYYVQKYNLLNKPILINLQIHIFRWEAFLDKPCNNSRVPGSFKRPGETGILSEKTCKSCMKGLNNLHEGQERHDNLDINT